MKLIYFVPIYGLYWAANEAEGLDSLPTVFVAILFSVGIPLIVGINLLIWWLK